MENESFDNDLRNDANGNDACAMERNEQGYISDAAPLECPSTQLPVAHLRLIFVARGTLPFPPFPGSNWRSMLSWGLKRSVCVTEAKTCDGCDFLGTCAYPYVVETEVRNALAGKSFHGDGVRPYVIRPNLPSATVQDGEKVNVNLLLVGHAQTFAVHVLEGLRKGAWRGIDADSGALSLASCRQEVPVGGGQFRDILESGGFPTVMPTFTPVLPAAPPRVRVLFRTPVRLRIPKSKRYVRTAREFSLAQFLSVLGMRVESLFRVHGQRPFEVRYRIPHADPLTDAVSDLAFAWERWERTSNRYREEAGRKEPRTNDMGGLRGQFTLNNKAFEARAPGLWQKIWPVLWLGQWTNVGGNATMGMGQYDLVPVV